MSPCLSFRFGYCESAWAIYIGWSVWVEVVESWLCNACGICGFILKVREIFGWVNELADRTDETQKKFEFNVYFTIFFRKKPNSF